MITIIGGGLCGLTLLYNLLEDDFDAILLEQHPPKHKALLLNNIITSDYTLSKIIEFFDIYPETKIFETIQIRDNSGRVILEHEFALATIDYNSLLYEIALRMRDSILWNHKVSAYQDNNKIVEKIRISGAKNKILHPTFITDCCGHQNLLAKKSMKRENYNFRAHNDYVFFHSLYDVYRHELDYNALNIIISDYLTPGGILFLYFDDAKRLHIYGFFNKHLSSIPSKRRVTMAKNLLGILGHELAYEESDIPIGRALLDISPFENSAILGRSALISHPMFYSGLLAAFLSTQQISSTLTKLFEHSDDFSFRLNTFYREKILPYTNLNEIMRLFILTTRSKNLIDTLFSLIQLLGKVILRPNLDLSILENIFPRVEIKTIANIIFSAFKNIGELILNIPTEPEKEEHWIKKLSEIYDEELSRMLPKELLK